MSGTETLGQQPEQRPEGQQAPRSLEGTRIITQEELDGYRRVIKTSADAGDITEERKNELLGELGKVGTLHQMRELVAKVQSQKLREDLQAKLPNTPSSRQGENNLRESLRNALLETIEKFTNRDEQTTAKHFIESCRSLQLLSKLHSVQDNTLFQHIQYARASLYRIYEVTGLNAHPEHADSIIQEAEARARELSDTYPFLHPVTQQTIILSLFKSQADMFKNPVQDNPQMRQILDGKWSEYITALDALGPSPQATKFSWAFQREIHPQDITSDQNPSLPDNPTEEQMRELLQTAQQVASGDLTRAHQQLQQFIERPEIQDSLGSGAVNGFLRWFLGCKGIGTLLASIMGIQGNTPAERVANYEQRQYKIRLGRAFLSLGARKENDRTIPGTPPFTNVDLSKINLSDEDIQNLLKQLVIEMGTQIPDDKMKEFWTKSFRHEGYLHNGVKIQFLLPNSITRGTLTTQQWKDSLTTGINQYVQNKNSRTQEQTNNSIQEAQLLSKRGTLLNQLKALGTIPALDALPNNTPPFPQSPQAIVNSDMSETPALTTQLDAIIRTFFIGGQVSTDFWTKAFSNTGFKLPGTPENAPALFLRIPQNPPNPITSEILASSISQGLSHYNTAKSAYDVARENNDTRKRTALIDQFKSFREGQPGTEAIPVFVSNTELDRQLDWIISTFFASLDVAPDFWEKVFSNEGFLRTGAPEGTTTFRLPKDGLRTITIEQLNLILTQGIAVYENKTQYTERERTFEGKLWNRLLKLGKNGETPTTPFDQVDFYTFPFNNAIQEKFREIQQITGTIPDDKIDTFWIDAFGGNPQKPNGYKEGNMSRPLKFILPNPCTPESFLVSLQNGLTAISHTEIYRSQQTFQATLGTELENELEGSSGNVFTQGWTKHMKFSDGFPIDLPSGTMHVHYDKDTQRLHIGERQFKVWIPDADTVKDIFFMENGLVEFDRTAYCDDIDMKHDDFINLLGELYSGATMVRSTDDKIQIIECTPNNPRSLDESLRIFFAEHQNTPFRVSEGMSLQNGDTAINIALSNGILTVGEYQYKLHMGGNQVEEIVFDSEDNEIWFSDSPFIERIGVASGHVSSIHHALWNASTWIATRRKSMTKTLFIDFITSLAQGRIPPNRRGIRVTPQ